MVRKILNNQISSYVLINLAGLGAGLLSNLLLAKQFSINEYSSYALYLVYSNIISVFFEFGIGQSIGQYYTQNKISKNGLKGLVSMINLGVLSFSLIPFLFKQDLDNSLFGLVYFVPLVVYLTEYTDRYTGHNIYTAISNNTHKFLVFFVVILSSETRMITVLYLPLIVLICVHLVRIVKCRSEFSLFHIKLAVLPNRGVWYSRCISIISQQGDKLLVSMFLSKEIYATYSFASTLVMPVGAFLQVRSNELFNSFEKMSLNDIFKKLIYPMLFIVISIIAFYFTILYSYYSFSNSIIFGFILVMTIAYIFQALYQKNLSMRLKINDVNTILKINIFSNAFSYLLVGLGLFFLELNWIVCFCFLFFSAAVYFSYKYYE